MRGEHQFYPTVQGAALQTVVGRTRHFRTHAAQHQAITLQTTEAEDRCYRLGAFLAELLIAGGGTAGVGVAEHQYGGLFIGFDRFGHTGDGAEGDRQKHGRTIRVVGAVYRYGNDQHIFTALKFELAVLDRFTQARFVAVQPGLGGLVVDLRHGRNLGLVTVSERPPPAAAALGLGIGLGDFLDNHFLHFLVGNLVRAKGPPVDATVGRTFLGVLCTTGHGQAQGNS
ncbi:hypothetical protein D3C72_1306690 [compost metagenome]